MMLILRAVGPFRLIDDKGIDRTPAGQKARCVLALLALSPSFSRRRAWVQDKLWSESDALLGAASLRQALCKVRQALGPYSAALRTDKTTVSLDPQAFQVSFDLPDTLGTLTEVELFDDIDAHDDAFDIWLRDQRLSLNPTMCWLGEGQTLYSLRR